MHAKLLQSRRLCATQRTGAHQPPLSMEFSWWKYWSGFPFPSLGDLPNPGIKPTSLALVGGFFSTEPPGKPNRADEALNRVEEYYTRDVPQVGSPSYESGKRSWSHSIWSFPTIFCVWGKSSWYPGGHLHTGWSWNEQWVKDIQVNRKVFNECRKEEIRWDNIIFWWKYKIMLNKSSSCQLNVTTHQYHASCRAEKNSLQSRQESTFPPFNLSF